MVGCLDQEDHSEVHLEPESDSEVGNSEIQVNKGVPMGIQSSDEVKGTPTGNANKMKHGEVKETVQDSSAPILTPTIVKGANETTMTGDVTLDTKWKKTY